MQPYLFPYVGYFQVLNAVDQYIVYDNVQYIKGGWINRNNILIGGNKTLFTISLRDASPNKLINQIDIQDDFKKFLKTIGMAYSRAPHKEPVMELLTRICAYEDKNLARFAKNSLQQVADYLGITTQILFASDLEKERQLTAQDEVIALCKMVDADRYINAIGGEELYDKEAFAKQGIELCFLQTQPISYKQLGGEFVSNLSIIDLLMFNSVEEMQTILNKYILV